MTPNDAQDATPRPNDAQEAPEVIRELQVAREAKWAETLDEAVIPARVRKAIALADEETYAATSALRQELAQTKAAVASLRLAKGPALFDEMMNAILARAERAEARGVSLRKAMEALADEWAARVPRVRALGKPMDRREANTWDVAVYELRRAALAAEPTSAAEPHAEDGAVPLHLDPSLVTNVEGDEGQVRRTKARMQALIDSGQAFGPAPVADPSGNEGDQG